MDTTALKNTAKKGGQIALVAGACFMVADYIIGGLDWKQVGDLPKDDPIAVISKNVGYFNNPALNSRCTAFAISENTIMTNKHCITQNYVDLKHDGATFYTNFQKNGDPLKPRSCDKLLAVSDGNFLQKDYAVFECTGDAFENWPALSDKVPERNDEILHVHQNCDYFLQNGCQAHKVYENGGACKVDSDAPNHVSHSDSDCRDIISRCDSLGGSSGSPYFVGGSEVQNVVIGLHHVGVNNSQKPIAGRGDYNRAVVMADIVKELDAKGIKYKKLGDDVNEEPPKETPIDKKWLANLRKFLIWLIAQLSE